MTPATRKGTGHMPVNGVRHENFTRHRLHRARPASGLDWSLQPARAAKGNERPGVRLPDGFPVKQHPANRCQYQTQHCIKNGRRRPAKTDEAMNEGDDAGHCIHLGCPGLALAAAQEQLDATICCRIVCSSRARTARNLGDFSLAGNRLSQWLFGPAAPPRRTDNWRLVGSGLHPITSMKCSSCGIELNCRSTSPTSTCRNA